MDALPISTVLGQNVRRLRTDRGLKAEDLAKPLRDFSPSWSSARIADLEKGRVSPTVATLFVLSYAFTELGDPVTVGDLIRSDGYVQVGRLPIDAGTVADAFDGSPARLTVGDVMGLTFSLPDMKFSGPNVAVKDLKRVLSDSGETEKKIAKQFGLTATELAAHSVRLWDKSFSARRDELAGPDANAQKRGRVSRELKAELQERLDKSREFRSRGNN
ncbi:helix-turn-helix domain-containing protein [Gordonia paraffinivorans]|uniref:helix-turn-helix domain-containing protein n=1 Tax=Gordonia paraffinivorans TaxID=175628 RepID=UPI0014472D49|nr:helix-turn-helix transcriptional regulator [Gordonia paraffinivorans]